MKNILIVMLLLLTGIAVSGQGKNYVITTDIANFWDAFDKINSTKDSAAQYNYLNNFFINKGTPGLASIMEVKRYTAKSYINAINSYPLFWRSIRANTLSANKYAKKIEMGIARLKLLYPSLKPAKIYFTVGALWTPGTTHNGDVLIGSEIAMTDKNTFTKEFPPSFSYLAPHFAGNPINEIVFLNVHEYIHTQQKTTMGNHLLAQCVLEGIAEFITVIALNRPSTAPGIAYGKVNDAAVKAAFVKEICSLNFDNWLWNDFNNAFKMRDLGYYVGYAIAEKYYQQAKDKKLAIKNMIQLDYNDEVELDKYINASHYFNASYEDLKKQFESSRPTVINIKEFKNGDQNISAAITTVTVEFSEPMDKRFRNFQLGPLGENNLLKIQKFIGFADDGKSISFQVAIQPNQQYQLIIGEGFRNLSGLPLQPYLIDFKTAGP